MLALQVSISQQLWDTSDSFKEMASWPCLYTTGFCKLFRICFEVELIVNLFFMQLLNTAFPNSPENVCFCCIFKAIVVNTLMCFEYLLDLINFKAPKYNKEEKIQIIFWGIMWKKKTMYVVLNNIFASLKHHSKHKCLKKFYCKIMHLFFLMPIILEN